MCPDFTLQPPTEDVPQQVAAVSHESFPNILGISGDRLSIVRKRKQDSFLEEVQKLIVRNLLGKVKRRGPEGFRGAGHRLCQI